MMVKDSDLLRSRSFNFTHALAYSLIIVGAIFWGLTLGGNYPAPRRTCRQPVKYALYVFAGITGVVAMLLVSRALVVGSSTVAVQFVLLVTVLAVLSTVGLTIYLLTLDLHYSWWSILINVLMLIQRVLYFGVDCMALQTLREADKDKVVAGHAAYAQGVEPATPPAAPYNGVNYEVV